MRVCVWEFDCIFFWSFLSDSLRVCVGALFRRLFVGLCPWVVTCRYQGFFSTLAEELRPKGIGVTIHHPGGIATEVQQRFQTSDGKEATLNVPPQMLASAKVCADHILYTSLDAGNLRKHGKFCVCVCVCVRECV